MVDIPDSNSPDELLDKLTFDPDESDIDNDLQRRDALANALAGTEFGDSVVLPLDAAQELSKPHFQRIIAHLKQNEAESVRSLARELDMSHGNLSRYLDTLMSYDVVELEQNGKAKIPQLKHAHVVFDPLY